MDRLPAKIAQGDLIEWTESVADYKASAGWILKYRLSGPDQIDIVSVADGDNFKFSISSANSKTYSPGIFKTQRYLTKGTTSITLEFGICEILENLADIPAGTITDSRSHVRKVFEALKAMIEGRATIAQEEIQIAGRMMRYMKMSELIQAYHHYERLVQQEEQAAEIAKGIRGKKILVRMDKMS